MADTYVWVAQILCLNQHTVLAAAAEADGRETAIRQTVDPLRHEVVRLVDRREITPWCDVCGDSAANWCIVLTRTEIRSLKEAKDELAKLIEQTDLFKSGPTGHPGSNTIN